MEIAIFYILSIAAFLIGTAAIYMALIEIFPVSWLYYHYFIRKPINFTIFAILLSWTSYISIRIGYFPIWTITPLLISGLSIILTYKMHQDRAFPAVFFPKISDDLFNLPITNDMELAVIEYDGITKCYPLDYVIHHHIINDTFNSKIVALTYCAMCRTIIPFDVTDIGPLFVGSFKNANLILADKKTNTFFQQATFKSIIGKLHPRELTMIPFQIYTWKDVKNTLQKPNVVFVSEKDFKEFQLPIPGIWNKIINSDATPGLSAEKRDKTFPSRMRVIGIIDPSLEQQYVYIKKDIIISKIVANKENNYILIASNNTVNGFRTRLNDLKLKLDYKENKLVDKSTNTEWNIRGKYLKGGIKQNLIPLVISDEYWFSWKEFHPNSKLIRVITD